MRQIMRLAAMVFQTIFFLSSQSMNQKQTLAVEIDESIESFNVTEYINKFLDQAVEPRYRPKSSLKVEDAVNRIIKLEKAFDQNFRNLELVLESHTENQKFQSDVENLREKYLGISDSLKSMMRHKARLDGEKLKDPDYFTTYARDAIRFFSKDSPLLKAHHIIRSDLSGRKPFLIAFIEQYQKSDRVCSTRMSPLQAVDMFLRHLRLVSAETFSIVSISYEIVEHFNLEKDEAKVVSLKKYAAADIVREYTNTITKYQDYLTNVSQSVYACNSETHLEECNGSSSSAENAVPYRSCQNKSSLNACCHLTTKEICSISHSCEKLLECQNSPDTTVCLSESTKDRRYDYYHPIGRGDQRYCKTSYDLKRKYYPDTQMDVANRSECKPIQCTCEEGEYWINMMPSFSKFEDDMVITGAKLLVEDKTLFVVIQEGELLPNGLIRQNSTRWLPKPSSLAFVREKITWSDRRTIELSKNVLGPDMVMTGLGFNRIWHGSDYRIRLEVLSSPHRFNASRTSYDLGKIHTSSPPSATPTSEELILVSPDVPTKKTNSKVKRVSDRIVKFTTSSGEDGGQSTVPFIDTQEIEPNPPTPLSGAGLYFKGHENSGGFIGLELFTYNFLPLTRGDPSEEV